MAAKKAKLKAIQFHDSTDLFGLGSRSGVSDGQNEMELIQTGAGVRINGRTKTFHVIPHSAIKCYTYIEVDDEAE